MAKPTPALIKWEGNLQTENYTDEEFDDISAENVENDYLFNDNTTYKNTIRFHAVVSEDHKSQTQITKFPVQNGFEISNHAIRKNRVITLEGVVSNTVLEGSNAAQYTNDLTSNTINTVYAAMQALVQGAVPCTVETNLGIYNPVIFTKISTKQALGMVDSIQVTMVGEEIQIAETVAKTGPKELSFIEVPVARREALLNELNASGIPAGPTSILSQATAELGEDFSFTTALTSGELFDVTYIKNAWDGISEYTYSVFTGNTDVFSVIDDVTGAIQDTLNIPLIPSAGDLLGGLDGVTRCLLDDGGSAVTDFLETKVDTFMGELDSTIYGAQQDLIKMGKDGLQKALIGTALDCVAVGVSDVFGSGNSENVEDIIEETLLGVKGLGDVAIGAASGTTSTISNAIKRTMTFTKIEDPNRAPLDNRGEENAVSP